MITVHHTTPSREMKEKETQRNIKKSQINDRIKKLKERSDEEKRNIPETILVLVGVALTCEDPC